MKLGEIYFWQTEKVEGRSQRSKEQVLICPKDDDEDNTFLYIYRIDWYKDFKLLKASYGFLAYDSFIGCSTIVTYTDHELTQASPQLVGQLSLKDMKGLRNSLISAETMERRHLNR